jgi:hypothetical protein
MSTVDGQDGETGAMANSAAVDLKLEVVGRADPDWPDWYAKYLVGEQSGQEFPA